MRVVIDTNFIASTIFFGGKPRKLLEKVFEKAVDSFVTPEIRVLQKSIFYKKSKPHKQQGFWVF